MYELPISQMAALYANSKRSEKSKVFKPSDFCLFNPPEGEEMKIPSMVADAFFSLLADNKMPGWVLGIAPLDKLRESKKDNIVPRPRAWIGTGVLILLPVIDDDLVESPFVLLDDSPNGEIEVRDVDSGTPFKLHIVNKICRYILNTQLPLITD